MIVMRGYNVFCRFPRPVGLNYQREQHMTSMHGVKYCTFGYERTKRVILDCGPVYLAWGLSRAE